jgi:hypothetical protein
MTQVSINRVVQAYLAIRDARTAKRHAWEKEDLALEEDSDKLKVLMLSILNQTDTKSMATELGTVYRSEKLKPSAADWGAIWEWAKANDGFEIVEKRLKTTFIKEYMEQNDGALPPGVNAHRQFEVSVRRNTSNTSNSSSKDDPDEPS